MTRSLPIFMAPPPSPLDGVAPLAPDNKCKRCSHAGGQGSTCLPHEGSPGGILVLQDFVTTGDMRAKRHLYGATGSKLRRLLEQTGQPVAYASALRCVPTSGATTESAAALVPGLTACSPYLVDTLAEIKPTKLIAMGSAAIYALTGSLVTPSTYREGFSWIKLDHGWVPVFYCISPTMAAKNKFLAQWMEQDFTKAATAAPITLPPIPSETWAKLIFTKDDAERCLSEMKTSRWTAVDCEWAGRPYDKDFKLLCLAMTPSCDTVADGHPDLTSKPSNEAWVWTQESLKNKECVALLKEWLRDPKHKKIGSYFKSDTVALHAALGVWTRGVVFDTRLLRKLMDAEASGKLADMAHLVGRGGHKDELADAKAKAVSEYKKAMAKGSGGLFRVSLPSLAEKSHADKILAGADQDCYGFAFVNPELLYRYNAADTVVTALVGSLLEHWLAKEPKGMQNVAREVVIPAGDAYARVESWGLRVDKPALEAVGQYLDLKIAEAANRFREYGYNPENPKASTFSPGSPQQVARLLFTELGLKSTQTTDSGAASTGADALEELIDQHPVVADILSWRGLSKMKATYVDGTLGYIRDDGRIHPTIHPDGARTGRTSSSNPNMQNAPSVESTDPQQAELARMYRDCFAPPAGHSLLEVDYSQLELRVAADLSGDPAMLDIFKQGQDYHLRTAQMLSKTLWNITPEEVTDTHRREVKGVNFALLYDDDPYSIAYRCGVDKDKAAQIRDAVFGCFPMLARWIQERVREAAKTGAAWTWWAGAPARRRPLIEIANLDTQLGKTHRRASWNMPIQGTGNEYLVASAIQVVDWLVSDGIPAKLLVTIHDSMLLEVRNDCMSEVRDRVLEIMCSHSTKNGVPLMADAKCGPTWARMVKWKAGQPCPLEGCR